MLKKLVDLLQKDTDTPGGESMSDAQKRVACAALLIEVAIIDNEFDGDELSALKEILEKQFFIPAEEIDDLITLAHNECSESTSMYQFTLHVNQNCSQEEKFELVTGMWRIAFADGDLDKYEEYIIRKVADLIHLGHGEFIRAKHAARPTPA